MVNDVSWGHHEDSSTVQATQPIEELRQQQDTEWKGAAHGQEEQPKSAQGSDAWYQHRDVTTLKI